MTQQQALEYDHAKAISASLEPEVVELVTFFKLSDRLAKMLNDQLKQRNNTYDDDIAAMYEILKGAKNPADLCMVSIRWMAEGTFRGSLTPNPDVEKVAKKYQLDVPSACKLADVLEKRDEPDEDLKKICVHLGRSKKPSSVIMMMLRDLKEGNPVPECKHWAVPGSYDHKMETSRANQPKRSRSRGGRGSNLGRTRSRSRGGWGRSRSWGRGRSRSRSRGGRGSSRSRGRADGRGGWRADGRGGGDWQAWRGDDRGDWRAGGDWQAWGGDDRGDCRADGRGKSRDPSPLGQPSA